MELIRSGTKIPMNNVGVLCLIDTCKLYGLINNGINKHNNRNTVQGFINDMVGNTNIPTVVKSCNKTTVVSKLGKAKPDAVYENNHDNTNLADTGLKSNNILFPTSWKKRKDGFIDWLTHIMNGTITTIFLGKRMNQRAHTHLRVTTVFLNSPRPSTTEN